MNRHVALFAIALVLGAAACSSSSREGPGTIAQRLAVPSDGGDGGDGGDAADGDADAGGCTHAICATGAALQATCDPCSTLLCAQDPYCCSTTWDATCVGEVKSICGKSCSPPPGRGDGGASTCAHPVCATGGALSSTCEPCATQLCAQDPYCCALTWDATCVGEVASICGKACN